jgi:hypothetical protein
LSSSAQACYWTSLLADAGWCCHQEHAGDNKPWYKKQKQAELDCKSGNEPRNEKGNQVAAGGTDRCSYSQWLLIEILIGAKSDGGLMTANKIARRLGSADSQIGKPVMVVAILSREVMKF